MNGRFLLDTNIIIALFAQEPSVQERLEQAEEVFVPSVVLGELYFGARKSTRVEENLARVDELAASSAVLVCNTETARLRPGSTELAATRSCRSGLKTAKAASSPSTTFSTTRKSSSP